MKFQNRVPRVIPSGWVQRAMGPAQFIVDERGERCTGLRILFSIDPIGNDKWEKHMSISRQSKYPSWEEMKDIIYNSGLFDPNKSVFMVLPPKSKPDEYVNVHENCFHWQQEI